jgi:transposase
VSKLFVGIDVSKDSSTAKGLDKEGHSQFYVEFKMDLEGFLKLLKALTTHCEDLSQVTVAMESTGCYHINLFAFLTEKGIKCFVINPLLITNFARLSLRKTKTDKKDASTIAQFLLAHEDSLCKVTFSQDLQDLKDLARERESLVVLISALKNDIKRMLQITFPELESLCPIFSETMLKFLMKFPSARLIKTAKPKAIARALIHEDKRKRVSLSSEAIIKAAKDSIASPSRAKELILPEKISTLLYLMEKRDKMTKALVEACEAIRVQDLEIITSIGGIRDTLGSLFLAEIGDYKAFKSYKHLIAFAGLDPSVHQSGQFQGISKISKGGNRHLRYVIYNMTFCVIRLDNVFRAYFLRRKKEGLPFKKALLATAHKLIRVIFAMLSNKSHFRPEVVNK